MAKNTTDCAPVSWVLQRRTLSNLIVRQIPLAHTKGWIFNDTDIHHENNSYFSIVAVRVTDKYKELAWQQPIILQQEVGILGFLIQDGKILLQAKTEPGNVNGTQIAPTVQATISNYTRAHGGKETKFLEYFLEPNPIHAVLSNSLQLEQGMRFMNKSNRNTIIRLNRDIFVDWNSDVFRWFDIKELLSLIDEDYLINTDARSALVSCNWVDLTKNTNVFSLESQDSEPYGEVTSHKELLL